MSDARANILLTMARLIEKQGYHATGLTEIIRESGAPKGSLYYYFPEGKEQIGVEAIIAAGRIISGRLHGMLKQNTSPANAVHGFLMKMAENMEATGIGAGSLGDGDDQRKDQQSLPGRIRVDPVCLQGKIPGWWFQRDPGG